MTENNEGRPMTFGEMMQARQTHVRLHMADAKHRVRDFMMELSKEQYEVLSMIFNSIDDAADIAFYRGQLLVIGEMKHDICSCKENHLEAHAECSVTPDSVFGEQEEQVDPEVIPDLHFAEDKNDALMEEYNVVKAGDEVPTDFKCGGCGIAIVSLDDRMLRPPGVKGCEGCQHKAKFG